MPISYCIACNNIYRYTTLQYNFEFETFWALTEHGDGLDECIYAHVIIQKRRISVRGFSAYVVVGIVNICQAEIVSSVVFEHSISECRELWKYIKSSRVKSTYCTYSVMAKCQEIWVKDLFQGHYLTLNFNQIC